jgi:undecaprenyl-diphosphatase
MRRKSWIGAADRALMARVASTDSVLLDRVLPTLGRAANHGLLWFGVATALGLTGSRRARRAALRGVVALSLASPTVNIVGKQLTGRVRPAVDLTPLIRQLHVIPRTTSFPSGHSASAAAFAAGVTMEYPLLGAPIALVAAGVAASRVATGAHYPSDVVAGVGIGVTAGLLTSWWWPLTPPGPSSAGAPEHPAPAVPAGRGLIVVTNSASGSADSDVFQQIAADLPDAEIVTAAGDDLPDAVADAARRCEVLGVAGGDGTVNLAARAAADKGRPLLVIPAGTLNHFARDIGVESVADAVDALRAGDAIRVDLGRAGDDGVFVNTSSVGLYVDLVRFREHWERRLGKWPALAVGLVHVLRRAKPRTLLVDGRERTVWMVFAGNGHYLPKGFAPAYRPRLDDGLLDVRIVDAECRFARTRIVLGMLTGLLRWCGPYEATALEHLDIESQHGPLGLSLDGEVTAVSSRVTLAKSVGALTVYRPAGAARGPGTATG